MTGTAERPPRAGRVPADDVLSWVGGVANLGAAVVHFAYAQEHLAEEPSHGAFFLVAGWAQLMLALGLGLRAAPRRVWAAASVAVNLGILGVWLVSRTVGVPGSDPESVGLADLTTSGLQAIAVLAARRRPHGHARHPLRAPARPRRPSAPRPCWSEAW